jgi:hypothetical protein
MMAKPIMDVQLIQRIPVKHGVQQNRTHVVNICHFKMNMATVDQLVQETIKKVEVDLLE